MTEETQKTCGDCGARPGELHQQGCDVERCPRCGGQAITCDCIYEISGITMMYATHPCTYTYTNGPTDDMYEKWDREWGPRRMPWTGEWPGVAECREFGWYSRWNASLRRWESCEPDDPEAREDMNRLYGGEARWDPDAQRWVKIDPDA